MEAKWAHMRTIFWDLFILSCVYLDVSLVIAIVGEEINSAINFFYLISIPLGFFIVAGSSLIANRFVVKHFQGKKPFRFRQAINIFRGDKKMKPKEEKKPEKKQLNKPRASKGPDV